MVQAALRAPMRSGVAQSVCVLLEQKPGCTSESTLKVFDAMHSLVGQACVACMVEEAHTLVNCRTYQICTAVSGFLVLGEACVGDLYLCRKTKIQTKIRRKTPNAEAEQHTAFDQARLTQTTYIEPLPNHLPPR